MEVVVGKIEKVNVLQFPIFIAQICSEAVSLVGAAKRQVYGESHMV